jgi:hypothetical protein
MQNTGLMARKKRRKPDQRKSMETPSPIKAYKKTSIFTLEDYVYTLPLAPDDQNLPFIALLAG